MFSTECSWSQVIAFLIVALTTYILYMIWIRRKYPPGPWPLPLIGNLHLISDLFHVDFKDLSNDYGPIYTLWLGWTPAIVICGRSLGKEVLLSKGKEFGGRALDSYIYSSITYDNEDIASRPYDEKLKLLRRVGFSFMKAETTHGVSVQGLIEEEVEHLLQSLGKMEGMVFDPSAIVTWSNTNILMQVCVSSRFKDVNDPDFSNWMQIMSSLGRLMQNTVDAFPTLARMLPWIRKDVQETCRKTHEILDRIISEHESTYQEGKVRDLMDVLFKAQREQGSDSDPSVRLTKTDLALFLLDIATGGAETNILWAIIVLLRHPEIQRKLQKELDIYVAENMKASEKGRKGARVLLSLSDRPNLPYFNAFIYEVLRRCAVIPIAVPHKALTDTSIGSYPIAKDTTVFVNIYAMHMSNDEWDNPETFQPERFLDSKQELDSDMPKNLITFGAGPRSCIGQNVVKMELFLFLANMLLNYEIIPPPGGVAPSLEDGTLGISFSPKPFSIKLKDRRK